MPTNVNWNGTSYDIPDAGELNWSDLSDFLVDLGNNAQTTGAQQWTTRVTASATDTIAAADMVILMTNSGARTCNLPSATSGRLCVVIDGNGNAATNNVSVETPGAETISGQSNYVINDNYGGILLLSDGTDWFGVASFTLDSAENPMTAAGDIIVGGTSGQMARLAAGSNGQALILASGTPAWSNAGQVPMGAIIPIASNLTGAHAIPSSGTVDSWGFIYCNGAAIPGGNTVSGTTPNITDGRFLRGSTVAGTTGGSATKNLQHTHSFSDTSTSALGTITLNHQHTTDSQSTSTTGGTRASFISANYAISEGAVSFNKNVMNSNQTAHSHSDGSLYAEVGLVLSAGDIVGHRNDKGGTFSSAIDKNYGGSSGGTPSPNRTDVHGTTSTASVSWSSSTVNCTVGAFTFNTDSLDSSTYQNTHTHSFSHTHSTDNQLSNYNAAHTHDVSGTTGNGGSTTQNIEPAYLNVQYVMRVN